MAEARSVGVGTCTEGDTGGFAGSSACGRVKGSSDRAPELLTGGEGAGSCADAVTASCGPVPGPETRLRGEGGGGIAAPPGTPTGAGRAAGRGGRGERAGDGGGREPPTLLGGLALCCCRRPSDAADAVATDTDSDGRDGAGCWCCCCWPPGARPCSAATAASMAACTSHACTSHERGMRPMSFPIFLLMRFHSAFLRLRSLSRLLAAPASPPGSVAATEAVTELLPPPTL